MIQTCRIFQSVASWGREIRKAFVARPGHTFVSADYSQFELRLAAVLAKDDELIEAFNDGLDIHTRTAAQVYGLPLEDVTKEQRRDAKVINFGILYGMSPHGLSVATGMSPVDAKQLSTSTLSCANHSWTTLITLVILQKIRVTSRRCSAAGSRHQMLSRVISWCGNQLTGQQLICRSRDRSRPYEDGDDCD